MQLNCKETLIKMTFWCIKAPFSTLAGNNIMDSSLSPRWVSAWTGLVGGLLLENTVFLRLASWGWAFLYWPSHSPSSGHKGGIKRKVKLRLSILFCWFQWRTSVKSGVSEKLQGSCLFSGQMVGYTSQQARSICMKHNCCLLSCSRCRDGRQQHPWVAMFHVSRGRRGMEKREITVFSSHVAQTTVRGLEHPGRGGPCTVRHRSGTVIIPLQAKTKSRRLELHC